MSDAPSSSPPEAIARKWKQQIELAEKDRREFLDDGKKVVERYKNDQDRKFKGQRRTAILYANTEMLAAALYSKPGKPDVRRRFADRDPVGEAAAEVIERTLIYFDDVGEVSSALEAGIQDYLLPGRGVVRVEYEPIIGEKPATDPLTGQPLFVTDDDGEPTDEAATIEFIEDQKIHHRHVFWQDFLASPARRWADVSWVAFRHTMDRAQIREEIYDVGPGSKTYGSAAAVDMDWTPDMGAKSPDIDDSVKKAEVWEIWDKTSTTRIWLVKSMPTPLRIDQDPYGLQDFFPMPEPLSAYRTTDSIIPQALYKAYQDQATDLDELTQRISILTRAMKRRGVYNSAIAELKRLANANDNEFIPVPNFNALLQSGGLVGNFLVEDISSAAKVLGELYSQRDMLVQQIYEVSGISDIMRGSTDPDETLGAQSMKAQFGSQRLKKMQHAVQRWIRDLNRIKVEIICRHFEADILGQITSMQVQPQVMQILQSPQMRSYRVDIETDSTIFQDQAAAQEQRTSVVQAVTQFIEAWGPIIEQKPQLMPLAFSLLDFAVATAPDSRQVQDAIDQAQQAMQSAPPTPPPGDGKAALNQVALQAAQLKLQGDQARAQADVQSSQTDAAAEQARNQTDIQVAQIKIKAASDGAAHDAWSRDQQHAQAMQQSAQKHAHEMERSNLEQQNLRRGGAV